MRRVGVIGAERIGGPVIEWLATRSDHRVAAILARAPRPGVVTDPDTFFAEPVDLVLERVGPAGLRAHGARALAAAEDPRGVRRAAEAYPGETSFAVAAVPAAGDLDAARIALEDPGPARLHRLEAVAECGFGTVEASVTLRIGGLHPVAAAVIAALRSDTQVIWAG